MMRWGMFALALVACSPESTVNDASVGIDADHDASARDAASTPDAVPSIDAAGADAAGTTDAGNDAQASDTGTDANVRCACTLGATCIQASMPSGCATIVSSCAGGMTAATCNASDVQASCTRASSTTYYDWARVDGRLATARTSCSSSGTAGTFSVATIPDAVGNVCSCQRSAAACVETHGTSCATLACTAGATASACDRTGAVLGRCVSRDGQTEIVYHGITPALAETTCHGASTSGQLYWFPDGIGAP